MSNIQTIDFPLGCKIINNDFYSYDPHTAFKKVDSQLYLNEDLLQCSFPADDIIIDLGWYGDVIANKGEFRIYIIIHENWEIPFNIIYSKSAEETKELLNKVLNYYSKRSIEQNLIKGFNDQLTSLKRYLTVKLKCKH